MLKIVIDNIPTQIYWKDNNGAYLGYNHAYDVYKNKKLTFENITGKTDIDFPFTDYSQNNHN